MENELCCSSNLILGGASYSRVVVAGFPGKFLETNRAAVLPDVCRSIAWCFLGTTLLSIAMAEFQ